MVELLNTDTESSSDEKIVGMENIPIRSHGLSNSVAFTLNKQIQKQKHDELEMELNMSKRGFMSSTWTKIENKVDLTLFVKQYIPIKKQECGDDLLCIKSPSAQQERACCCSKGGRNCCSGALCNYDKNGTLKGLPDLPDTIYECNLHCRCHLDKTKCRNRVIQLGSQFTFCIFRVSPAVGWGLKACNNIPAGSFVIEYLGEVISDEEATKREEEGKEGITWMIGLSDDNYVVDGTFKGNEARYINHSCDPNLQIVKVYVDHVVPHVTLFAVRDIPAGDELSFLYCLEGQELPLICQCGASNCKGKIKYNRK